MIIICLIIIAFLIVAVFLATQKIKSQDNYIKEILEEKSKMSDSLRIKGNEAIRLMNRIKKLEKDKS